MTDPGLFCPLRSALCALVLLALPLFAQQRLASDFEMARMEKQLAESRGFEAQLSGRLNLGDVRAARNELSLARAEYGKALELAERERLAARRDSSLTRYANATSYAALTQAKLGRDARAFELLEEAARYVSDDAETWNLYASAMRALGHPRKAVSAARNAVAVAKRPLDVAVYQHALATALIEAGEGNEAERLLVTVTEALRSVKFAELREEAARQESFEVYSSARGDVAAYVSLLNRAQLRLASLYEKRGARAEARVQYARVLEGRSDDVTALAALARLAPTEEEAAQLYADAFQANPFSQALIREYRKHPTAPATDMQRALVHLDQGELRAARVIFDALLEKFPENETLRGLRREAEGSDAIALPSPTPTATELRALANGFERLTPEQRAALDRATFTSVVTFDGEAGSTFASGTVEGVAFRFSEPATFQGTFEPRARLTYRILGVGDNDALLLEPLRLEPAS
jgi:tetratricopeptide (TPR) repeat protein